MTGTLTVAPAAEPTRDDFATAQVILTRTGLCKYATLLGAIRGEVKVRVAPGQHPRFSLGDCAKLVEQKRACRAGRE